MKNLLVPVDFSDTSATALRFGTYLAEVLDLDLRVIHVYDASFSFAQVVSRGAMQVEQERLADKLRHFVQRNAFPVLATYQGDLEQLPAIKTEVIEGYPIKIIRKLSEAEDTELVVMGGVGAGTQLNPPGLFGGVARGMGLHGGCPVILLPADHGYPSITKMAVAFQNLNDVRELESITTRLCKVIRPELQFVHVGEDREDTGFSVASVKSALRPDFLPRHFFIVTLPQGPVTQRLLDHAETDKIGMLVIGHRERGAWEGLFSGSRAKPMMRHSTVPLMIVPLPANN